MGTTFLIECVTKQQDEFYMPSCSRNRPKLPGLSKTLIHSLALRLSGKCRSWFSVPFSWSERPSRTEALVLLQLPSGLNYFLPDSLLRTILELLGSQDRMTKLVRLEFASGSLVGKQEVELLERETLHLR